MKRVRASSKVLVPAIVAVAAAVALIAVPTAQAASSGGAQLIRGSAQGRALPVRDAVTWIGIRCQADPGARCRGRLRLLPRGRHALGRVGRGAIAERRFAVPRGHTRVALRLSRPARRVLRLRLLNVEVRLIARGRQPESRRATLVGVTRERTLRGGEPQVLPTSLPGAHKVSYSWDWDIPAAHMLLVPEFKCPADAPYIETNGLDTGSGTLGKQAKLTVSASRGTGYGSFYLGKLSGDETYETPKAKWLMVGWYEGDIVWNNIWAPVFQAGHFSLTVTCTSAEAEAAWMAEEDVHDFGGLVFPWLPRKK